jgi:hypothetical protein
VGRDKRISELIWVGEKQKYFSQRGLTSFLKTRSDLPVGLICRSPMQKIDLPRRQISKQGRIGCAVRETDHALCNWFSRRETNLSNSSLRGAKAMKQSTLALRKAGLLR